MERICLEGDFATVIAWIQGSERQLDVHPLIRDVWASPHQANTVSVRHVYQEANTAVDWMAAYVAKYFDDWIWRQNENYLPTQ